MIISRVYKKAVRAVRYNSPVIIVDSEWVGEKSERYKEDISAGIVFKNTNIPYVPNMQMNTYMRELYIQKLCQSKTYTLNQPLVIKNPYGYVPLSALMIFNTESEYSAKVWVDASHATRIVGKIPATKEHRIPIIGLFAASKNYVNVELYDGDIFIKRLGFVIETEELPTDMKNMVTVLNDKADPAFPFYYVSGVDTWYPYIFDQDGRIRYYITKPSKNYGVFPISNGRLLHSDRGILKPSFGVPHSSQVHEMDLWGRIRRTLCVDKGLHHDAVEITPGGNLLIASSSLDKYCEDSIVEIDRFSGKPINIINVGDVITEKSVKNSSDWAHINTVWYCKHDNTILVCLRNLHSVVKINWDTHKLVWILGDPEFWMGTTMESYVLKPVGSNIKWFYQAHSSFQVEHMPGDKDDISKIIIYDNHWQSRRQTENFDNDERSFGVVYNVNETSKTVTLNKRFVSNKSSVRSNIVYSRDKNRMLLMSGCLNEKYEGCKGLIYDYRYSDTKLMRLYGIKRQFYRAYPYEIDYNSLVESIGYSHDIYGEVEEPIASPIPDVSEAFILPIDNVEPPAKQDKRMKTRTEKEAEWERMTCGKTWEELDHTDRIARTRLKLCGNIVYLYGVDHIVEKIHFVGKNNSYCIDYTGTKQELPAIFYDYGYFMAISAENMNDDRYDIYISCFNKLYNLECYFEIQNSGGK